MSRARLLGITAGLLALITGGLFLFRGALIDYLIYPRGEFDASAVPPAPDYRERDNWAALPDRIDGADTLPPGSGASDGQANAAVDVFFLYPTSYFFGGNWNAATDDWRANWVTDNGVLPQQASAFNGVARVYAPRYRQASQGAQIQSRDMASKYQALDLALTDIARAFDYYLASYNQGRPFFIASHSQGTTHAVELVKYLFHQHPEAAARLVAAYLIGNTVVAAELTPLLNVCSNARQTGCFLSWNAVLRGGDGSHWQSKGKPLCVNPLSWRHDEAVADASLNLGSIPITGMRFIDAPHQALTGARCSDGILWIDRPAEDGYDKALFPGGGYHAYDYNLFYMNIRQNARQRAQAYLAGQATGIESTD